MCVGAGFDGLHIDGKTDDYVPDKNGAFVTSAQGEGAIEGVVEDYGSCILACCTTLHAALHTHCTSLTLLCRLAIWRTIAHNDNALPTALLCTALYYLFPDRFAHLHTVIDPKDPFSTSFKFGRFDSAAAAPRDISKLNTPVAKEIVRALDVESN